MRLFLALLLAFSLPALAQSNPWQAEQSGAAADLRGIHAVGGGVAWASGTGGTVLRTEDSGYMWQSCAMPPGAEKLDFRAIWAWDANHAIVMSSGPGALSRLYETTDGCDHWTLLRTNSDPEGFWDAIAFSGTGNGYLLGDPVDGELVLEHTVNGGHTWTRVRSSSLNIGPRGAFAASNGSLTLINQAFGGSRQTMSVPWIATGGPSGALVLEESSMDCGPAISPSPPDECLKHFNPAHETVPVDGNSASSGIFSLALNSHPVLGIQHGVAVGGDYTKPSQRVGTAAWWAPQSKGWIAATTPPGGYRSSVAWDQGGKRWITVGPNGSDSSRDDGRTWQPLEHAPAETPKGGEWNALSLPWVVGPHGRIAKLNPDILENAKEKTAPVPR